MTVAAGREAGERLGGLPVKRRPTAAFCGNDLLALGLLQEMIRQGLDVPNDVAIVGYDDIEFAAAAAVPLTSVRQPRHLLGKTAADLLLEETQDPAKPHPPADRIRARSRRARLDAVKGRAGTARSANA